TDRSHPRNPRALGRHRRRRSKAMKIISRTLSFGALVCSFACNGSLVVSDGGGNTVTCTDGRLAKFVVEQDEFGGMQGAALDGNAGYLLHSAVSSNSSIVHRSDAEG